MLYSILCRVYSIICIYAIYTLFFIYCVYHFIITMLYFTSCVIGVLKRLNALPSMRAVRNMAGDETSGASSNVRHVSICGFCHDVICFYACTISYSICLVAHIVFISFLASLTHSLSTASLSTLDMVV